jgi:hypothetical protein
MSNAYKIELLKLAAVFIAEESREYVCHAIEDAYTKIATNEIYEGDSASNHGYSDVIELRQWIENMLDYDVHECKSYDGWRRNMRNQVYDPYFAVVYRLKWIDWMIAKLEFKDVPDSIEFPCGYLADFVVFTGRENVTD